VPLVFDRGFTEQFSYLKILLTKLTVLLGLVAWALALLWGRLVWPPRSRLALPLALLSLAILVSCFNSPVPVFSLREAAYFLCGPAWVLLFISWSDGEAMVRRAAMLAAVAGPWWPASHSRNGRAMIPCCGRVPHRVGAHGLADAALFDFG